MDLHLYHAEPLANSLKCLIALHEKELPFESHYVNLQKFEQTRPEFVAINPEGQVPVLVHDGAAVNHSSVINEYLDDAFPETLALRPADALSLARMRAWNKFVDEEVMPFVSIMGWHKHVGAEARKLSDEAFEEFIAKVPLQEQKTKWRTARAGFSEDVLANARRKVRIAVDRVEAQLEQTEWLAGTTYSLADINYFAHCFASLARLFPEFDDAYPRATGWAERMKARPGVQRALAMPNMRGKD